MNTGERAGREGAGKWRACTRKSVCACVVRLEDERQYVLNCAGMTHRFVSLSLPVTPVVSGPFSSSFCWRL